MLKKFLKICIIVLAVWLCIGITDYILVAVMEKETVFCSADECCHYSGIGYEFDIYTSPYTGNPEYAFYIFGRLTDCNFTNGG
ncbi:MAG: hypothetical protein K2J32_09910 [Ruminococcus sp.]|nr:hypothetical protein [Ruminococcus sp.]